MSKIVSKDNQLVKHLCKLRDSSRYRWDNYEAIIYGEHLVVEAMRYGILKYLIISHTVDISFLDIHGIKVYTASSSILNKISNLDSCVDMIGVIKFDYEDDLSKAYTTDCMVLENIQDPGNLGTIMRTAKASSFNTIVLSSNSVDVYNPKVIRASQGVQFGLSIIYTDRLEDFIKQYQGITIATLPNASQNIYQYNLSNNKFAWFFGNEGNGLSNEILELVDVKLSIPMDSSVDSLNVAIASSICLFETYRQRGCV